MSYTNNDPTRLNQMAAHDTGLYDAAVHDNEIVALYDTDVQARSARSELIKAGVPESATQLVARPTDELHRGDAPEGGFWGALKSLFIPDDDRTAYSHAIGRGHAMLIVRPEGGVDRTMVVHTLETTDPVDFDARLEEWRQAGYDATGAAHHEFASHTAETGYASAPTGRRETSEAARVRSYVVDRQPAMGTVPQRSVEARAASEEPVVRAADSSAATAGAASSGTNAPRQ